MDGRTATLTTAFAVQAMVNVLKTQHSGSFNSPALTPDVGSISRNLSEFSMAAPSEDGDAYQTLTPVSWSGTNTSSGGAGGEAARRREGGSTATAAAGSGEPSGEGEADAPAAAGAGAGGKIITVSSGQALKCLKAYGQLMRWAQGGRQGREGNARTPVVSSLLLYPSVHLLVHCSPQSAFYSSAHLPKPCPPICPPI